MPQLSLYLDENIHSELEMRAKLNKTSVSKFVAATLKSHFSKGWPDGYFDTFGSITDESFIKHEPQDWHLDVPREKL